MRVWSQSCLLYTSNQDIDTTQTHRNVHFKKPTDSYAAMFDQMIADGAVSYTHLDVYKRQAIHPSPIPN